MLYAVGDIHGQYEKLCVLLNKIEPTGADRIVFIGDYIDRGPDSAGVVQTLIELADSIPCVFLRGNHEQLFLEARAHFDPSFTGFTPDPDLLSFSNGGADTLISYTERFGEAERWFNKVPETHWEFYVNTQMEYHHGGFAFVHAGFLPPGDSWEGAAGGYDPRLWIREPFLSSLHNFGETVVFGHTPQHSGRPLFMPNKIGIDTAAAYGGPLTAIGIAGNAVEVVQV